jgi:hypothetical protein
MDPDKLSKSIFFTGHFKFEPPLGNIFEPHQYYILRKQYIMYVLYIAQTTSPFAPGTGTQST